MMLGVFIPGNGVASNDPSIVLIAQLKTESDKDYVWAIMQNIAFIQIGVWLLFEVIISMLMTVRLI